MRLDVDELIERLQLKRDVWRGTEFGDDICELLDEAAAALEAAREDADKVISQSERYANEKERDPSVVPSSRLCIWASDPRAAIDQARGKGVADES